MAPRLEQWLTAPAAVRFLCWLLWSGALLLAAWLALAPARRESAALQLRYQTLAQALRQQRQLLVGGKRAAQLSSQIAALEEKLKPAPLAAFELVQTHGAQLVRWSPQGMRSELVVDLNWPQTPAFFARLAQYDVEPRAFTLAPHEKALRLSLQLEAKHEE